MNVLIVGLLLFANQLPHVLAEDKNAAIKTPQLVWNSLEAGLAEAKKTDRKVLIDVYTNWCGWCKRMDKETFNHADIATYLSKQYVLVKLNAESSSKTRYKDKDMTETELARAFGVRGYPTLVFLDPRGEIITVYPGYVKAEDFLPMIKFIGESAYEKMKWDAYLQQYEKETKNLNN